MRAPRNALATLRTHAGISPAAAAENLQVDEAILNDIESGKVQASTQLLANMARLYGASPHAVVKAYLADRRG
jgi:ribosome-binding protein aMBF1 (putative translation factor)